MNAPPTAALPCPEKLACLHCGGSLEPSYSEIDFGEEYTCELGCQDCGSYGPTGSGETMEASLDEAVRLYAPVVQATADADEVAREIVLAVDAASAAALSRVRSLLEAKAKEWEYISADLPTRFTGRNGVLLVEAKLFGKLAQELLALAATLGNQGK